ALGLKPVVIINKIDRSDARPEVVVNEVFDLFAALEATEEQLDFPVLYASGRNGWAIRELNDERGNLDPLFDLILAHVPPPDVNAIAPLALLVSLLAADPYLGRILTGRLYQGTAKIGMPIRGLSLSGEVLEQGRLVKLLTFDGIKRVPTDTATAGDIIAI